ncbi:MAG TPA: AAA family ATPase [Terriglobia bacterium]|nr:AAA family ATPase [Terriglobia bacterium]
MNYFDDEKFQDSLVAALCRDKGVLERVGGTLTSDDFKPGRDGVGWARWVVSGIALDFWNNYGAPVDQLLGCKVKLYVRGNSAGQKQADELLAFVSKVSKVRLSTPEAIVDSVVGYKKDRAIYECLEEAINLRERGLTLEKFAEMTQAVVNREFGNESVLARVPDIWEQRALEVEWAVPGLIPMGSVTLIAGIPGGCKSWLVLALSKAITHGEEVLGRKATVRPVVYCDLENPPGEIRKRLDELKFRKTDRFTYWGLHCKPLPPLIENGFAYREAAKRLDPKPVFIFDSFVRFNSAESENDARDMAAVMARFRSLAAAGAAVVILHHVGKSNGSTYRGSSDILAGVDMAYTLSEKDAIHVLQTTKNRLGKGFAVSMRFDLEAGGFFASEDPRLDEQRDEVRRVRAFISEHPGSCQKDIIKGIEDEVTAARVREILKKGQGTDWLVRLRPHNKHVYVLIPRAQAACADDAKDGALALKAEEPRGRKPPKGRVGSRSPRAGGAKPETSRSQVKKAAA